MILNFSFIRLIIIISFALVFPFIQKQWFNLHLFSSNDFSFYSILYYFSGIICPLLVCLNSIKGFTYYRFYNIKNNNLIIGKTLLVLILITLIPLSLVITTYFHYNINLISNVLFDNIYLSQINEIKYVYLIFIIFILLIFRKTRIFIKKLILLNFLLVALIIWYAKINNILISDKFLININFVNVIFLFIIEVLYYCWSFISDKNNISDWSIPFPLKGDVLFLFKISFLYLLTIIYYSILG